ncbi:MAG TPA: serine/threonine-protein kinase [Halioglobus sp.]
MLDNYVGPYRILRLINRGGQGSVYLGYDKRLHRRVAIKIYPLPASRPARRHLLREARLVASIQSPKVVQIHDVIESGTHLALVMEYVPGCNLEEFLAAVRPSLASVLTIGADIAGALALARQQHIVHGDVKAGNVLLTECGRAKLTDFGISRRTGEGLPQQWKAGSFSALSPEQFLGQPLDERADLFALGSLLYRMLSGEQPFFRDGQFDPDLLLKRSPRPLRDRVGGAVELPDPLVDIVAALLEKDPQKRPANTRVVRQVFRGVLRGLPMSSGHSLLREARPCFRPESPEDIPPLIPSNLGQQGRSALPPSGSRAARFWHQLKTLRWPARIALGLAGISMIVVPLLVALHSTVTPVRFAEPQATVSADIELPPEISRTWLLAEVKEVLSGRLDNLKIVGSVGAGPRTILYSRGEPKNWREAPEQVFRMALRCVEGLCVFAISREQAGARFNQHGVLFPDMSLQQWRDIVRSTTLALYP